MEKSQRVTQIPACKLHKGRVWHGVVERRTNGGMAFYCKPSRITVDSWAEHADDFTQCKEHGWKMCVGCDRSITDIEFNGN
jgi:hypothetical protein